ncbi:UDP-N-acetylmuramoyl-L-alanyl-D-glutamate--2,6-diaminopimelate ligase [Planococcus sp. CPCC 101016]|uniref:UDP-N-acetylmuramoyl-L-alanyl-D-glutamate--2, 6-diaminopimelate ligase n=1 Tax=Planococcus sp. CPCC 101016 TaxID=2599617 RepID=UPI0011B502A5|nr:UDP-N-acetylmuramoyl-L-alanyl-D-glutamate--2,6-diaminopimelate ligase [Planococcus sp. CPCC 101016]TWT08045.1 UDP-N-acetylmuramoyl-L-alanyl-D-glutamate--2,6-diaminopimelate ligase [Planococcus sp. CPCC 101016]
METIELLDLLKIKKVYGDIPSKVTGIQMDSRKVKQGNCFICVVGSNVDGHNFIEEAIRRGASLIVAEKQEVISGSACFVLVKNSVKVLSRFVQHFYCYPSSKLAIFGVTGTNGKTTVSHIIYNLLEANGRKSAASGTLGFRTNVITEPTQNTTSDILSSLNMMQRAIEQNCEAIVFETSSQGIINGRMWGIDLDIAIFTNLTHDHLDYHKTMEHYGYAKGLLFAQLGQDIAKEKFAVLNHDDPWAAAYSRMTPFETITYGLSEQADFYADQIEYRENGTVFLLHSPQDNYVVSTSFIGEFNVYNMLAAIAALYAYGLSVEDMLPYTADIQPAAGRMEKLSNSKGPAVYIDYSHTPDAIEKAINSLLPFKKKRLIVVIGSGNFRDRLKRPMMAEKASVADYVIITVNNPGKEPISGILKDFEKGMQHDRYVCIGDRAEAIRHAINLSTKDDIVLLTDKGHENTILIGSRYFPHSDKEIALEQVNLQF